MNLAKPYLILISESVNVLPLPLERDRPLAEPVLHWCVRGTVSIDVDGVEHHFGAGSALWVPGGRRVRVRLGYRDVVVPVPGLTCGGASGVARLEIPPSWHPWLLHAFAEALGYLDDGSTRALLQRLIDAAAPVPQGGERPAIPGSEELRELAAAIVAAPAIPVAELVRRTLPGWSLRTLQRRFVKETGLTPERWARRQRLAVAAEMLAAGEAVASVAQRVGYATSSGFARPFAEFAGMSPGAWRRRGDSGRLDALRPAEAPSAAFLPAQRTWPRANGSHVAVWVVRGIAEITAGGEALVVEEGGAVVLPAGVPNSIRLHAGSLLLPVGYRSGQAGPLGLPRIAARVDAQDAPDLIQAMVSAYTTVRPSGADSFAGFDRVCNGSTPHRAGDGDARIAALASAVSRGEVGEPTLARCARWLGVSERDLSGLIRERAGVTFAQWIRVSRMSRARAQLHGGEAASAVSRGLGYAHLPAFSRAFREVHGRSPQTVSVAPEKSGEAARWRGAVARRLVRG